MPDYPIGGYMGKILEVDLSSGRISSRRLDEKIVRDYVGGRGLGAKLFYDGLDPAVEPLSKDNVLVFATGPLTGTKTPASGRFTVSYKSPLSGTIGNSNSGGQWGVVFKKCGYDALVVRGKSPKPVYISIKDNEVAIHPAGVFWGMNMHVLTDKLIEKHGKGFKVLGIGQAGENKVRFAAIINDKHRALGRGGPGAVMGSKNLKAIIVNGSQQINIARPDMLKQGINQAEKMMKAMAVTSTGLGELGTAGLVQLIYEHDMLPHNNFQDVKHAISNVKAITGEAIRDTILKRKKACFNCAISCTRGTEVDGKPGEGPEYETVVMMGANLGIYDLKTITRANYLCNEYGIDTISLGGTVAAAMELYENGFITKKDTDGLELKFGNGKILLPLIEMIALRKGIGDKLAEGSFRLAKAFGHPELAMVVKGLEIPAYDPRATISQTLGYVTSNRGACHLQGGYSVLLGFFGGAKEVDRFLLTTVPGHVAFQQDAGAISDYAGTCRFTAFAFGGNELSRIFSGVMGIELTEHDLETVSERIHTLERLFNVKAGFGRADDSLPERFFTETIYTGGKDRLIDREKHLKALLDTYYELRGWDENGVPKKETLKKFKI
ncbi:MAG: aldehyde ferredoxin oxidoreductase family protein [Planctomycetes bacterium]|nr:aldehyde ferredoxin oxidoreductase family protein [Planctomycetota bacterium]